MNQEKKILVIDDELQICENVTEYLKGFGFKTISAHNGVEGVQKAIKLKPDLILCDIDMPSLNGYGVYEQIQEIPDLAIIPFIFLTAKSSLEELREGMQLGADDYITKPFKLNDVLLSINRRLEKTSKIKEISEQKIEAIAENNLVGIFFYDRGGFSFVNKKLRKIIGIGASEFKMLRFNDIITGGESDKIIEKINACLNGVMESISLETFLKTRRDNVLNVYLSLHRLVVNNKKSLVGIVLPINEIKGKVKDDLSKAYSGIIGHLMQTKHDDLAKKLSEIAKSIDSSARVPLSGFNIKYDFSDREKEVLSLICKGLTNNEIADKLFLSSRTVENHRSSLLRKSNSKNTAQLVVFGIKFLKIKI